MKKGVNMCARPIRLLLSFVCVYSSPGTYTTLSFVKKKVVFVFCVLCRLVGGLDFLTLVADFVFACYQGSLGGTVRGFTGVYPVWVFFLPLAAGTVESSAGVFFYAGRSTVDWFHRSCTWYFFVAPRSKCFLRRIVILLFHISTDRGAPSSIMRKRCSSGSK